MVLAQQERENTELKAKLEEVQSPAFIERMARETLGMVKEGETVVLVPKTPHANLPAGEGGANDQRREEGNVPKWRQWWKLFF